MPAVLLLIIAVGVVAYFTTRQPRALGKVEEPLPTPIPGATPAPTEQVEERQEELAKLVAPTPALLPAVVPTVPTAVVTPAEQVEREEEMAKLIAPMPVEEQMEAREALEVSKEKPLTIILGPEGEPKATPPRGITPEAYDWMGNAYPSIEAMQSCISTYGPQVGGIPEQLAQCSIRSWRR